MNEIIAKHPGWKAEILTDLRDAIMQTDPNITIEIKWRMANRPEGLPVWVLSGNICFAETWKDNIKLLFPKGAQLKDPDNLFNARLQSKDIRAIEFKEGDVVNAKALQTLIQEAIKLNS